MPTESFINSTSAPNDIHYRQAISPNYLRGSFTHDTANHDFLADGRGKGRFSVCIDTTNGSSYTCTVYGRHDFTTDGPTALGVFTIGTVGPVTATNSSTGGYETVADPFPFYLVRIQSSDTSVGSTGSVTLFIDFSAF